MKTQLILSRKVLFILTLFYSVCIFSQNTRPRFVEGGNKKYNGSELGMFDKHNELNSKDVEEYDIKRMLQMAGLTSYTEKMDCNNGIKEMSLVIDEYKDREKINSDTIGIGDNTFTYFRGDTVYSNYIKSFKVFVYSKEKEAIILFNTPNMQLSHALKHCTDSLQEYRYRIRKWNYPDNYSGKRKNIITYASAWKDKGHDFYRFCGVSVLKENDKGTQELLNNSPHYFTIGYILR